MQKKKYFYLIKVQFLGYRLHGWQHQPDQKTVEGLIKKTLKFVLSGRRFKILGAGRTDAMVSAQGAAFELFLEDDPLEDFNAFLQIFNKNLPADIKVLDIRKVDASFNIIQNPKVKEYAYFFSFGSKNHPFCAPLMANFIEKLDVDLMKKGAKLFEGIHNMENFSVSKSNNNQFEREIFRSEIEENHILKANFFPEKSFVFHVHGRGFLRYQIRLMMGSLVQLGRGDIDLKHIKESLLPHNNNKMDFIAPASGLILNEIHFQ